jgi:phosphatidylinositol-3,4,5-trisphosphate 3-phosphatase/dual-specificity protein phosphatase PTEN
MLRDEIFCQIIKQTTENPSTEGVILGFKLLYMCLLTYPPSDMLLQKIIIAHIANIVVSDVSPDLWFDNVESIAIWCYKALRKPNPDSNPHVLSYQVIEEITENKLPAISVLMPDGKEVKMKVSSPNIKTADFCASILVFNNFDNVNGRLIVVADNGTRSHVCAPEDSVVSVYLQWETDLRIERISDYHFEFEILTKAAERKLLAATMKAANKEARSPLVSNKKFQLHDIKEEFSPSEMNRSHASTVASFVPPSKAIVGAKMLPGMVAPLMPLPVLKMEEGEDASQAPSMPSPSVQEDDKSYLDQPSEDKGDDGEMEDDNDNEPTRFDIECVEDDGTAKELSTNRGKFTGFLRKLVSKKKKRLQESGFDLDMSYITDRIIAMGYPADDASFQSNYRNPYSEVFQFLETFHQGKYKVYNLCSERSYEITKFKGCTARFPFADHGVPDFELILDFCEDISDFLEQDEENTIAIHCKAGKGRTGLMICAYLLYSGQCADAQEALQFFAEQRTLDGKGVTIPSQIRYVHHFQRYITHFVKLGRTFPAEPRPIQLVALEMNSVPHFDPDGGCDPYIKVKDVRGNVLYDSRKVENPRHYLPRNAPIVLKFNNVEVAGDVKFELIDQDPFVKDDKMCSFYLNTTFLPAIGKLTLKQFEIDGAVKDKKNKYFDEGFQIRLEYKLTFQSPVSGMADALNRAHRIKSALSDEKS